MTVVINSKLNKYEKKMHEKWIRDLSLLGGKIYSFEDLGVTVAVLPEFPGSNMNLVSVSMPEWREKKFRPRVGEYHALRRMFQEYEYIKVRCRAYDEWVREFARSIA